MVTHDLRDAIKFADEIYVMDSSVFGVIANLSIARDGEGGLSEAQAAEYFTRLWSLLKHHGGLNG
jgi:ABC-type nitrate/sulfonate/bicarbonate transport system ATPase subunit